MSGRTAGPHGSNRLVLLLCLGILLTLVGCTAAPFGEPTEQERSVPLIVNNSANMTHTFEVYVFELPASMTVHYQDGTVVESEIGQGLSNHETGPRTVTNIDFPESAQHRGRYTLQPDEENQSSIKNFPRNGVLFIVASKNDGEIFAWVSANCGDRALVGLEVTSENTPPVVPGVSAAYGCR